MKYIKLIAYYCDLNDPIKRTGSPAAINVINYIIKILLNYVDDIELISPSWIIDGYSGYVSQNKSKIFSNVTLVKAPSFGSKNRIGIIYKKVLSRLWLIFYLYKNMQKNETIMIYHEPTLMLPVKLISIIKKLKIVMIVEELYSSISIKYGYLDKDREIKYLQNASSYIFPTELLNYKVNINNKPYQIIHGTYSVEKNRNSKFNDGKVHIAYAGTFNTHKGGAAAAAAAAEFLNEGYHIHIIGFGSEKDKQELQDVINKVIKKTKCSLTFDGLKSGEEYLNFLQSCDIGLSTQNPDADFNSTSFPSKILSYLSNGLKVVSIRISVIEKSKIGKELFYYDEQKPEKIASAVRDAAKSPQKDGRKLIAALNLEAIEKFKVHLIDNS